MSKHALLAASSAHRWMNCTPCAVLEAAEPDTTSESAKEGTLAHAIAELKLRKHYLEPMGPQTFSRRMKKFKDDPLYNEEMQRFTDEYMPCSNGFIRNSFFEVMLHEIYSPQLPAVLHRPSYH